MTHYSGSLYPAVQLCWYSPQPVRDLLGSDRAHQAARLSARVYAEPRSHQYYPLCSRCFQGTRYILPRWVEISRVETTKVETTRVETTRVETTRVETTRVETTRVETTRVVSRDY